MTARLRHIALSVRDVERAQKFFEDAFGMEKAGGAYLEGNVSDNPDTYFEVKCTDPEGIVFDLTHSGWRGAVKEVTPAE